MNIQLFFIDNKTKMSNKKKDIKSKGYVCQTKIQKQLSGPEKIVYLNEAFKEASEMIRV